MWVRTIMSREEANVQQMFRICVPSTVPAGVYLLQQLPEPVQLGLELFVVVLQDLHAGFQPSFVLPQQFGLGDELGVAGALRRHRQHLRGRRQRRQALSVVGLLQAVVLGL